MQKNNIILVFAIVMIFLTLKSAVAISVILNSTVSVVDNTIDDYNTYKFSSQGFKFSSATSQLWFSDYPFVELNNPTRLTFRVLRDSDYNFIVDDCNSSVIDIENQTLNLTYNVDLKGYTIALSFDKVENVPFTARFRHDGAYIAPYRGELKVRRFGNLTVQIFSDDNATNFNKKYSAVIAYSEARMKATDSAYFTNIISTINNVNDYLLKTLGMLPTGKTWLSLYTLYPTPVFYGFLVNGKTVLRIPKNESMTLRLLGASTSDGIVVSGNSYSTLYYKKLKFDVPLTNTMIKKDSYIESIVTNWDTNWSSTLWSWIILILSIIAVIIIPLILYAYTGNSQLAWNVLGILIVIFGGLNLGFAALRGIFGF
jgi:hypothetical protein